MYLKLQILNYINYIRLVSKNY